MPVVFVDNENPILPCDTLFMNNYDCMRQLTQYLIGLGHRSFIFVGGNTSARSYFDRWRGFLSVLEENSIEYQQPSMLLEAFNSEMTGLNESVIEWVEQQINLGALPTVFVCVNDMLASNIIRILRDSNVTIPKSCSVTGFDDVINGDYGITTVRSEMEALGRRAADVLLWRVRHKSDPFEKILISGDIIIKGSTAAPLTKT